MSRLQRVWLGQRNLGQQSLEIVLSDLAQASLEAFLNSNPTP